MAGRGSRGRSPDSSRRSLVTSLAGTAEVALLGARFQIDGLPVRAAFRLLEERAHIASIIQGIRPNLSAAKLSHETICGQIRACA
jgi:hypothetical protein